MYAKTLRKIIEEGAETAKNVSGMVSYLYGYLGNDGRTYDAVIVLNAIREAANDGIIEW